MAKPKYPYAEKSLPPRDRFNNYDPDPITAAMNAERKLKTIDRIMGASLPSLIKEARQFYKFADRRNLDELRLILIRETINERFMIDD